MNINPTTPPLHVRGMLLIECIVYLALFLTVLGLAFAAFYEYWSATDAFGRDAADITRSLHAGEQWRADIRTAAGPVEATAGNGVQTLRIPTRAGAIIYTFANAELRRNAPPAGNVPILSHIKTSQMQSEMTSGVSVCRWELELLPRKNNPKLRALFTFAAVPNVGTSP